MILGALLDAGVALDGLREALAELGVQGYTISRQPAQRGGVSGTLVTVELDEEGRRPRGWESFVSAIENSGLDATVKERACAVFHRLVEAEAVVHRTTVAEVHLHELGTVDTLVDVVGSVVGLDMLGIERLYCSPFPTGSGVVHSAHGVLPVPAPATAALFAIANAPVVPPPGNKADAGEMVTPTGAAILTTLATFRQPAMKVERVAYGLGSRDSRDYPNALGLWLGDEVGGLGYTTDLSMLETNVDDMAAELFGYVQERLFELGARDVWFTPIQMKKNRPATMISVIVAAELEVSAVGVLLRETSTLGVRVRPLSRYEAEREVVQVETSLGSVPVKVKRLEGTTVSVAPEYEACRAIALERSLPLQEVYRLVQREAGEKLLDS